MASAPIFFNGGGSALAEKGDACVVSVHRFVGLKFFRIAAFYCLPVFRYDVENDVAEPEAEGLAVESRLESRAGSRFLGVSGWSEKQDGDQQLREQRTRSHATDCRQGERKRQASVAEREGELNLYGPRENGL